MSRKTGVVGRCVALAIAVGGCAEALDQRDRGPGARAGEGEDDRCQVLDLDGSGVLDFGDFALLSDSYQTVLDGQEIDFEFFVEFAERFGETCDGGGEGPAQLRGPGCVEAPVIAKSFIGDFMSGSLAVEGGDFVDGTRHRQMGVPNPLDLPDGLCTSGSWLVNPEDVSGSSCAALDLGNPSFCPGGGTNLSTNAQWTVANEILFLILKKFDIKEDPLHPDSGCLDMPGAQDGRGECHRLKSEKTVRLSCDPQTGELLEWGAPALDSTGGPEWVRVDPTAELENIWGPDVTETVLELLGLDDVDWPQFILRTEVETVYDFAWREGNAVRFAYGMRGRPNRNVDLLLDALARGAANGDPTTPAIDECPQFAGWDRDGDVYIWHTVSGRASCACEDDHCEPVFDDMELHGSGFPTHRLWTPPWPPLVQNWRDPEDPRGRMKWGPRVPPDEEIVQAGIGALWMSDSGDNVAPCDFHDIETCESPANVPDLNGDGAIGLDELERYWCEQRGGVWHPNDNGPNCTGADESTDTDFITECSDDMDHYYVGTPWTRVGDADYDVRAIHGWIYPKSNPAARISLGGQTLDNQCMQPDGGTGFGFSLPWYLDPQKTIVLELTTSSAAWLGPDGNVVYRQLLFSQWLDEHPSCTITDGGRTARCELTKEWLDQGLPLSAEVLSDHRNYLGPNWVATPPDPDPELWCQMPR